MHGGASVFDSHLSEPGNPMELAFVSLTALLLLGYVLYAVLHPEKF